MKRLLYAVILMAALIAPVSSVLSGYGAWQNATITGSTIAVQNYPIKLTVMNTSGVSTGNTIYTNGTTSPNWYDFRVTNWSTDTIYPQWIESTTSTSATIWFSPSDYINQGSGGLVVRVQYQNSTTSAVYSDADSVFTWYYGCENPASAINVTKVKINSASGGSVAVSGGVCTINGATASYQQMYSNDTSGYLFARNTSVRTRFLINSDLSSWAIGYNEQSSGGDNQVSIYTDTSNNKYYMTYVSGTGTTVARTTTDTSYTIGEVSRNTTNATVYENDAVSKSFPTTQSPTASMNFMGSSRGTSRVLSIDWALTRKYVWPEPAVTAWETGGSPSNTLLPSFTPNATTGYAYPWPVTFTDTSTGSPTTWNWTFGDTYTSTSQSPSHIYSVAGAYTVSLNVTNSTGSYNTTSQTVTLTTDDDAYLQSWVHFNTSPITGEKGVAWLNSGCSIDTSIKKFGAGSLYCPTSNNYAYSPSSSAWNQAATSEVEFWVYVSSVGAAGKTMISRSAGGTNSSGWGIVNTNATNYGWSFWEGNSAQNATNGIYIPLTTWTHIVVSKNAGTINIYKDGVLQTTKTSSGIFNTANPFQINQNGAGVEHSFYIDEFRYTVGVPRFVSTYSPPVTAYVGSLSGGADPNPNSTYRYKTNPTDTALIVNQTGGGVRNRTVQVQNLTYANYLSGGISYNPIRQVVKNVYINRTDYSDLSLVSYNIDNAAGVATFNVSRFANGTMTALFDNRTNLVDFQMLYWNYTSDSTGEQYFTNGMAVNGGSYPIHNFIMTPITFGAWNFAPNFSASTTTPHVSDSVTFTATSDFGYPSAWNWSWGDGTWSNVSTAATTHSYSTTGAKDVVLYATLWQNYSVVNTSSKPGYITVGEASALAPQDIYMVGEYVQTFYITDSTTNLPIGNATITASNGRSATTASTGYATLTMPFGSFNLVFTANGYEARTIAYVFDQDESHNVALTPSGTAPTTALNTWYTPHQVRFAVVDNRGSKIVGSFVCATAVAATFPTGTTWLADMYGAKPEVANEMLNGTLIMHGITQSDGSTVFTMHSSIGYALNVTNPANGVVQTVNVTPIDSLYTIHLAGTTANNTYLDMGYNTTLYVTEPDIHNVTMHLAYQDMSARTTLLEFFVVARVNNTLINYQTATGFGSGTVRLNFTVPNVKPDQYSWYYNGVRTV